MNSRNEHLTLRCVLATLLFCGSGTLVCDAFAQAHPPVVHPLDAIAEAARSFALGQPSAGDRDVVIGALDRRLRMPLCVEALEAFWPPGARQTGSTAVGVRCDGERPWKLFVPMRIVQFADVVVVARPLSRGQALSADDVRLERRDVTRLAGRYVSDLSQAYGRRTRKAASVGDILSARQLEIPDIVAKGQTITLIAAGAGISVHAEGVALSDASLGDVVRVRNSVSGQIVEGRAVAPGRVRVPM